MGQQLVFRIHAIQRMFRRGISEEDVRQVLVTGDVIARYPNDRPYPSRLILGWRGNRPIHVVAAENPDLAHTVIITVYEPDPALWDTGFRKRKL